MSKFGKPSDLPVGQITDRMERTSVCNEREAEVSTGAIDL
jgi:hypothetical protein